MCNKPSFVGERSAHEPKNHYLCGMEKLFLLLIIAAGLTFCGCSSQKKVVKTEPSETVGKDVSPHTLLIWYDASMGTEALLKATNDMKCEVLYKYSTFNAVALRVPGDVEINAAIEKFQKVKGVTQVSRDRVYHLD